MSVSYVVVGGTQHTSTWLRARITGAALSVRYSTNPNMLASTVVGPVSVSETGMASIRVEGLTSDTPYWYELIEDGADEGVRRSFTTFPEPGTVADWTIAAASCAGSIPDFPGVIGGELNANRVSNHPVFSTIANTSPLMFVHMGDMHYGDVGSGAHVPIPATPAEWQTTYRKLIDDSAGQPRQAQLYGNTTTAYLWDDHDFGPNDSSGTSPGRDHVITAYKDRWPHYPLGAGVGTNPIYQSWQIGRVIFLGLDVRSDRSPNDMTEGPDKQMLGPEQLAWMRSTLEATSAQALVIVSGSQWIRTTSDAWSSFDDERALFLDILEDTGFIKRCIIISGDAHEIAIDTGSRSPGGIPVFQFASMDSHAGGSPSSIYDTGPSQPGRNQWGTVSCRDTGDQIILTGTCMVGASAWRSYAHPITAIPPDTPEEPEEPLPPEVSGRLTDGLTWYAVRAGTGDVLIEIPEVEGDPGRLIGAAVTSDLHIPWAACSSPAHRNALDEAIQRGETVIVAESQGVPVWSGLVRATERGSSEVLRAACTTIEGYLDGRRVTNHGWATPVDLSTVIKAIMADAESYNGVGNGMGILLDVPIVGTSAQIEYLAESRKTVLQALQEIMEMENGPEWTIDTVWRTAERRAVNWILRVRPRLGIASDSPDVTFEATDPNVFETAGDSDATYTLVEDFTPGAGANIVGTYSTGEGDSKPLSAVVMDMDSIGRGVPIVEYYYQPAHDMPTKSILDGYAREALTRMKRGSVTIDIQARWNARPLLGYDWNLGDDIAWILYGPGHPMGLHGKGRVMGWSLDPESGMVKPILWEPKGVE